MHAPREATLTPRIAPLDRARTLVTLLVVLHHAVVNYTYFGHGDPKKWLGFDLVVLFNDSFFMALMFLISGLFVCGEWERKGVANYLRDRAWRLGVPFLVSIFVLMPVAYYPTFLRYHLPGTTDFNFLHFWWRTITIGPWPSGPSWFLWVLLAFDVIAAAFLMFAPNAVRVLGARLVALRDRPLALFAGFLGLTLLVYVPLRLAVGDSSWLEFGPLPVQTSRIGLYGLSFLAGFAVGAPDLRTGILQTNGALARRWSMWAGFAALGYAGILLLVYARHNWLMSAASPPDTWQVAYSIAFALFSASMAFTVPAAMLRFADRRWPMLDALQPSAYGVFLVHYIFIIWIQYALYGLDVPAFVKMAIVFVATLVLSWLVTLGARKVLGRTRLL